MATTRQPNSSSLDEASPVSEALSRRKSPRKPAVIEAVAEEEKEPNQKKNKKNSKKLGLSVIKRIWNEEDELTVLKRLVDYRVEKGRQPNSDWDAFYRFIGDSIVSKFTREQLLSKISKLKRKFLIHMDKINRGNDPLITDPKAYELSSLIWGQNDSQFAAYALNKQKENAEEVANAEPLNENVVEKSNNFDDKITENETTGKESHGSHDNEPFGENEQEVNSEPLNENIAEKIAQNENHDNDIVTDELCAVKDAYMTLISQGLSSNEKKMQVEKLMEIGNEKIKEISEQWREVCADKAKLKLKKLRFALKLAEKVNDN